MIGSSALPAIGLQVLVLRAQDCLLEVERVLRQMDESGELPGISSTRLHPEVVEIMYTKIRPPVCVGYALPAKPEAFCGIGTSGLAWSGLAREVFCFTMHTGKGLSYVALADVIRNPLILSSLDELAKVSRNVEDFRRTLRRNTLGFSRPRGEEYAVKQKIVNMLREGYRKKFGRVVKSKGYLPSVDLPVIELDETVETIYQRKDVNWQHLLMPQRWETSSKLMEVRTIIPETGFGAYREWWVRDQLCNWSEELGLAKGKDFDIGVFPGTCVEGVIPDSERTKTKYPDFAYIYPLKDSNVLFFIEVGGDSGYYMIPEVERALSQSEFKVQQAKAGWQKTFRLFKDEKGGWNFNPGSRIMDNIPKIASLRTFDAPLIYVYVCDLFNAIPMIKDEKLEREDIEVPAFDESSKGFRPSRRTHTRYTYEDRLPIVHAFYLEASEFVEYATHFFGKRYGTRIGKQGRTMEPKIQIDLRQYPAVHYFKTSYHDESFKGILRNILDLHASFNHAKENGSN